jgi:hypothetical protein
MAMRFKRDVDGAATSAGTSLLQSKNFSVLDSIKSVKARSGQPALAIHNYSAYERTRRSERCTTLRKLQGLPHKELVLL